MASGESENRLRGGEGLDPWNLIRVIPAKERCEPFHKPRFPSDPPSRFPFPKMPNPCPCR